MNMEVIIARKPLVHVEISVNSLQAELYDEWYAFIRQCSHLDRERSFAAAPPHLKSTCRRFIVEPEDPDTILGGPGDTYNIQLHIYIVNTEEAAVEEVDSNDQEWTAACENFSLPHVSLEGLWESLIFEKYIGRNLIHYANSSLFFAEKGVDSSLIGWNRLLLLHGPPGTGKTSLCRALAQKLSIRLDYPRTSLLEVHSHSLFSKWFSTSGKLIAQVFEMVRDMALDDPSSLVCVILDEIESLASSRSKLSDNGEPSDAVRAVNSLLTSIDKLRVHPNVLILATTNLPASVDDALLDRADLKIHIGLPCLAARYEILRSCVLELVRVGIVENDDEPLLPYQELPPATGSTIDMEQAGNLLLQISAEAKGLSGRTLRRLPLKAHALNTSNLANIGMTAFLHSLRRVLQEDDATSTDWDESDI